MFTRRHLGVAAVVLVFTSAALLVSWLWNSSDEHPRCVPNARATFEKIVSGGSVPLSWESAPVPSGTGSQGCSGRSTFSIRPDGNGSRGLAMSYERFGAAWNHTGASVAAQRLAEQRPPDAAEFDLSDSYGDEGYLDASELEGQSRVELVIRDRNVIVSVNYWADRSLSQTTATAEEVARSMLGNSTTIGPIEGLVIVREACSLQVGPPSESPSDRPSILRHTAACERSP
jgi:hypothetical protein